MAAQFDDRGNEISLFEILANLRKYRLIVISISLLSFVTGVILAFVIRPVYRAEVTMIPVSAQPSGSGAYSLASQFPGLSGIVGLSADDEEVEEALATLTARNLTIEFIADYELMPQLFESMWNSSTEQWAVPEQDRPTLWDAYQLFDQKIRRVVRDKSTGIITLTIDWHDPDIAAFWANTLVAKLNSQMRSRAVQEAERNLSYLRKQLDGSSLVEIQQGLSRLIETQINNIMLANSREDYSFRVIDPAVSPDSDAFIKPNRPLLIIGGAIAGLFLSLVLATGIAAVAESNSMRL